ncbi:MAG TPA: hypothetical protein VN803_10370 [Gemmatimonadales bacterium]|nr:hypothetical protein [Gemmatimonadales bacterium]
MSEPELTPHDIARVFDLSPWLIGIGPMSRFTRLRLALRGLWPLK